MCSEKQAPKRDFLAEWYRETAKRLEARSEVSSSVVPGVPAAKPSWANEAMPLSLRAYHFFYETHLLGTAVKLGLAIKQAHGNYEMII